MVKQINLQNIDFLDFKKLIEDAIVRAVKEQINPPKPTDLDIYTREETSKILKISLPTLHDWTLEGMIISYRIGGRVYYKKEDIENALTLINPKVKRGGISC